MLYDGTDREHAPFGEFPLSWQNAVLVADWSWRQRRDDEFIAKRTRTVDQWLWRVHFFVPGSGPFPSFTFFVRFLNLLKANVAISLYPRSIFSFFHSSLLFEDLRNYRFVQVSVFVYDFSPIPVHVLCCLFVVLWSWLLKPFCLDFLLPTTYFTSVFIVCSWPSYPMQVLSPRYTCTITHRSHQTMHRITSGYSTCTASWAICRVHFRESLRSERSHGLVRSASFSLFLQSFDPRCCIYWGRLFVVRAPPCRQVNPELRFISR